jgi:hypothetical protein
MVEIIIRRRKSNFGKSRSEQEENLRKEGWGSTMEDEQLDKCKFIERKIKEETGATKTHLKRHHIDRVK